MNGRGTILILIRGQQRSFLGYQPLTDMILQVAPEKRSLFFCGILGTFLAPTNAAFSAPFAPGNYEVEGEKGDHVSFNYDMYPPKV